MLIIVVNHFYEVIVNINQLTFTCSKSIIETFKKRKICLKLTLKTPEQRH